MEDQQKFNLQTPGVGRPTLQGYTVCGVVQTDFKTLSVAYSVSPQKRLYPALHPFQRDEYTAYIHKAE